MVVAHVEVCNTVVAEVSDKIGKGRGTEGCWGRGGAEGMEENKGLNYVLRVRDSESESNRVGMDYIREYGVKATKGGGFQTAVWCGGVEVWWWVWRVD